jgi:NADH-quinone oxidoreductase subunit A
MPSDAMHLNFAAAPVLAVHPYASILVLILGICGIVALIMVLTHVLGPRRRGPVKDSTYEAGMPTIGDARRRFNVRFYLVAMLFLLFDVEVIFLWPWAVVFHESATGSGDAAAALPGATFLLISMAIFVALLVVGFIYDWGKGVFRWS